MRTVKQISFITALMLVCAVANAQDTIYQNAGDIHLIPNNPARTISGMWYGQAQGDDQGWRNPPDTSGKWYCMNTEKGGVRLEENERKVKNELNLKNGTTVTGDGRVIQNKTYTIQLQGGECISENGEIE